MRRLIPLLIACSTFFIAHAAAAPRDGNWWRELSATQRTMYVAAFFDGMDLGCDFSSWGLQSDDGHIDPSVAGAVKSFNKMMDAYTKNVTTLQIADGLTKFYEDYRNRKIQIAKAVWLVLNAISGKSEQEMEKMTESFRKNAN
jgi:hypothetical protein